MELTSRQKDVFAWICSYIDKNGFSPSRAEIASGFGFHPNAAQNHVEALERKGFIRVAPGISRGIVVVGDRYCLDK